MSIEHGWAFALFAVGAALLAFWQFWQRRRREHPAGSLLIWRRVAPRAPALPKRRFQPDRHFFLQCSALLCLAWGLSVPTWNKGPKPANTLLILIDNGSSVRATLQDKRAWNAVLDEAKKFSTSSLGEHGKLDIQLITTSPEYQKLGLGLGLGISLTSQQALAEIEKLKPSMVSYEPTQLWQWAKDWVREHQLTAPGPVAAVVISARQAPPEASASGRIAWRCVSTGGTKNVGLTVWGGAWVNAPKAEPEWELLIQARNFSKQSMQGSITLEMVGAEFQKSQPLALNAEQAGSAVFRIPMSVMKTLSGVEASKPRGCWVRWKNNSGPDAWPEDDTLWLAFSSQPFAAKPRIRFNNESAPQVLNLYKEALGAVILGPQSKTNADMDVYVDIPPDEAPDGNRTHGILLLAPQKSLGALEIGPEPLERPTLHLGESDPLTRGIADSSDGIGWNLGTGQYRKLEPLGVFKTLLTDQAGRPVGGRMLLKDGRPMFVLAFVPGAGFAKDKKLDDPGLSAMLLRMLFEAAGTRDPFVLRKAVEAESLTGKTFPFIKSAENQDGVPPQEWESKILAENAATGWGVLDAQTSALSLGETEAPKYDMAAAFQEGADVIARDKIKATSLKGFPLWGFAIFFTLLFIWMDWWWTVRKRAKT